MSMQTGALCTEAEKATIMNRYNQRMTLDELRAEVDRQRPIDVVTRTKKIEVLPTSVTPPADGLPALQDAVFGANLGNANIAMLFDDAKVMDELDGPISINNHTLGQFGLWSGIPRAALMKFSDQDPELLACIMTRELRRNAKDMRMVRTLDANARAWLGGSYATYDAKLILDAALPFFMDNPDWNVTECTFTETHMRIRLVRPNYWDEVRVGDVVCQGALIETSEVGAGALRVCEEIHTVACTNTQTYKDQGISQIHRGIRLNEGIQYGNDTLLADKNLMRLKVRDSVKAITDGKQFRKNVTRIREMAETEVTDPSSAVQLVAQDVGFTKDQTRAAVNSMIRGGDTSTWGVVSAITDTARDLTDYNTKVDVERKMGTLSSTPRSWGRVVNAKEADVRKNRRV